MEYYEDGHDLSLCTWYGGSNLPRSGVTKRRNANCQNTCYGNNDRIRVGFSAENDAVRWQIINDLQGSVGVFELYQYKQVRIGSCSLDITVTLHFSLLWLLTDRV